MSSPEPQTEDDAAVKHLIDLRDLAYTQGKGKTFQAQLNRTRQEYSNRPAFIRRLREFCWVDD